MSAIGQDNCLAPDGVKHGWTSVAKVSRIANSQRRVEVKSPVRTSFAAADLALGDVYEDVGEYEAAEHCYKKAYGPS